MTNPLLTSTLALALLFCACRAKQPDLLIVYHRQFADGSGYALANRVTYALPLTKQLLDDFARQELRDVSSLRWSTNDSIVILNVVRLDTSTPMP